MGRKSSKLFVGMDVQTLLERLGGCLFECTQDGIEPIGPVCAR